MAPIRKRSRQPKTSPTSTKPDFAPSAHKTTTKESQLPIATPKPRPLPQFLNQPSAALEAKYAQITAHESTNIITRANAMHSHPISHTRDRYSAIRSWSWNAISLSALNHPYINASPIRLALQGQGQAQPKRDRERFIATQGPLGDDESTDGLALFWEMVWQEGSEVIVMLTGVFEEGKVKCGVYFPQEAGDVKAVRGFGSVECVSKILCAGTEVRELKIVRRAGAQLELDLELEKEQEQEHEHAARTTWHFQFLRWPDFGVPTGDGDVSALLELIKLSRFRIDERRTKQDQLGPRIVHCSAGVGRTGTFIALDHLLQELKSEAWEEEAWLRRARVESNGRVGAQGDDAQDSVGDEVEVEDPVYDTVMELREQRTQLVYNKDQYAFIYEVMRKVWEARYGVTRNPPLSGRSLGDVEENQTSHTLKRRRLSPRVRKR